MTHLPSRSAHLLRRRLAKLCTRFTSGAFRRSAALSLRPPGIDRPGAWFVALPLPGEPLAASLETRDVVNVTNGKFRRFLMLKSCSSVQVGQRTRAARCAHVRPGAPRGAARKAASRCRRVRRLTRGTFEIVELPAQPVLYEFVLATASTWHVSSRWVPQRETAKSSTKAANSDARCRPPEAGGT